MRGTPMKRSCLVFIVFGMLVFFSIPSFAIDWGFKFGMSRVGCNLSNGNFPFERESRSHFIAGAFAEFSLSKKFSIQPELYFSKKGTNFFSNSGWIFQNDIFYLDIPLLLEYKFPLQGGSVPKIFIGPYYGIKVESEVINIFDNFDQYMIDHQDNLEDAVQNWDYGLVFGGSVEVETCFATLIVDIRYNLGLANILKDPAAYNHKIRIVEGLGEGSSLKNRSLMVLFGLSF